MVFLVACFIVGSGVSFYKKRFTKTEIAFRLHAATPGRLQRFGGQAPQQAKVNINTAGFKELIKLKGIGEKTAIRIMDYREESGSFFYKEDIMKVKGIGEAKFRIIKESIVVE